jgi:hypothetical protein
MKTRLTLAALFATAITLTPQVVSAWDYEGHRVVNQLALVALPTNFPAFVKTPEARERIAFLAGEPDRWRNINDDQSLSHYSGPDHYCDLEELEAYGLTPETVPTLRYDMTAKMALVRAAHPEKFEPIDPLKNKDHTRELIGFAPWAIAEYQGKLRSAFSYLKAFRENGGTPAEIANAEANIIYIMGVMGHFVGDCAQPLHVTKHHHGWVGPNPNGYATNSSIHSWIDGGFFKKVGGAKAEPLTDKIKPAKIVGNPFQTDETFRAVMNYLLGTEKLIEPLYQLNKDGKLTPENPSATEGRAFLDAQLVRGGQMLGDLWFSAWQQATEDKFLVRQLKERAGQVAPRR